MRAHSVESDSLSPTDPRDYRLGNLLGAMMVMVGALVAVILVVVAISSAPTTPWVWTIEAMIMPALLALTGLLIIGRAKLALWLMYVLTADFAYSLIREFVRALGTRKSDDIYRALLDACVLSVWCCIATYFYNRRRIFTGFWGSLEANKTHSVDARNPTH